MTTRQPDLVVHGSPAYRVDLGPDPLNAIIDSFRHPEPCSGHFVLSRAFDGGPWGYRGHHPKRGLVTAGGFPTETDAIAHAVGIHRFDTWETL